MLIQILDDNRNPLAEVEFNTVQIVRCIKRNSGYAKLTSPITQADIASYLAKPIITTGESYKAQMFEEDAKIKLEAIQNNPGDLQEALRQAQTKIDSLNSTEPETE